MKRRVKRWQRGTSESRRRPSKQDTAMLARESRSVALAEQIPECWFNLGLANASLGRANRALINFDRALQLNPKLSDAALARGVGIRFKGREREDIEEYCVSEGWVRAPVGKTRDRKGNLLTIKLSGPVEPCFLTPKSE